MRDPEVKHRTRLPASCHRATLSPERSGAEASEIRCPQGLFQTRHPRVRRGHDQARVTEARRERAEIPRQGDVKRSGTLRAAEGALIVSSTGLKGNARELSRPITIVGTLYSRIMCETTPRNHADQQKIQFSARSVR